MVCMSLVREGQKLNLIFNKEDKTVEITCVVSEVQFDRIFVDLPKSFMRYINYLATGCEVSVRVFSTAGLLAFNSIIINGGLEEVFSIEYDENFVRMEPYSDSPSVEEIINMTIKDPKSNQIYAAKTIEIGTKGVKFLCEDALEIDSVYDFVIMADEEYGNIEFSGLINGNDEVFPNEYEMSYTKISGSDRQDILRFIYSVG